MSEYDPHAFVKSRPGAPGGFFALEAAGLRWLKEAEPDGGARVVDVLEVGRNRLVLERVAEGASSASKAREFGQALAITHGAGAESYGAAPAGWEGDGYFGPLDDPRPMRLRPHATFGEYWATDRIRPAVSELGKRPGGYTPSELAVFDRLMERLCDGDFDDDEPPARVHGDLWWGNLMWDERGAVLIDPAAHGGHREEDLAMLGMFGTSTTSSPATNQSTPCPTGRSARRCTACTGCSCTPCSSAAGTRGRRWTSQRSTSDPASAGWGPGSPATAPGRWKCPEGCRHIGSPPVTLVA